jgi:hypothetical protein
MDKPAAIDLCPALDEPVEIDPQLLKLVSGGGGEGDGSGGTTPPTGDAPKGTW